MKKYKKTPVKKLSVEGIKSTKELQKKSKLNVIEKRKFWQALRGIPKNKMEEK